MKFVLKKISYLKIYKKIYKKKYKFFNCKKIKKVKKRKTKRMKQNKYNLVVCKGLGVYYIIVKKEGGRFAGFYSGNPEEAVLPEEYEFMKKKR